MADEFDLSKAQPVQQAGNSSVVPDAGDFDLSKAQTVTQGAPVGNTLPEPGLTEKIGGYIPHFMEKPLAAVNKYAVEPFNKMAEAGTNAVADLAEGFSAAEPGSPNSVQSPSSTQLQSTDQLLAQHREEHPTETGIARGVGGAVGGLVADPRNWPLFASSAARPFLQKIISGGFATMLGKSAIEGAKQLYEHGAEMTPVQRAELWTSTGLSTAFATLSAAHAVSGEAGVKEGPKEKPQVERTVLRPTTTEPIAGVKAPITALQQENPSLVTKALAKLTTPGLAKEFQREQTAPAATKQLYSTLGQRAEDIIARHEAIRNNEPMPEPIAGTDQVSKHVTPDDAANAMIAQAKKTYTTADDISATETKEWEAKRDQAIAEHKQLIDEYNQNVDEHNKSIKQEPNGVIDAYGNPVTVQSEEPLQKAVFNSNSVKVPERPVTFTELQRNYDTAIGNASSADAVVRDKAINEDIPKAEKAMDSWMSQHSDQISPQEYQATKSLYADANKMQDVANKMRAPIAKNVVTGNTMRGIEASIDNKAINRGQRPGAFKRLLGDDAYQNWKDVAKLFDPVNGAPQGLKSWGAWAAEYAAASLFHVYGIVGKAATEMLLNRVMFNPEWGAWFKKTVPALRQLWIDQRGEAAIPGTGQLEKFELPDEVSQEGKRLMDEDEKLKSFFNKNVPQENDYFGQAKAADPNGNISSWAQKAQKLKDAASQPKTEESATERFSDQQIQELKSMGMSDSEIESLNKSSSANPNVEEPELSNNASGESPVSQEALNRDASNKRQGIKLVKIKANGEEIPLVTADAVDATAGRGETIVKRYADGHEEIQDQGRGARYQGPKTAPKVEQFRQDFLKAADQYNEAEGAIGNRADNSRAVSDTGRDSKSLYAGVKSLAKRWSLPINLERGIPSEDAVKTEIPLSELSVSTQALDRAQINRLRNAGSKTQGPIRVFYDIAKKQFLVEDGMHRVAEAVAKNKTAIPAEIWSGTYSDIANVRPEDRAPIGLARRGKK